MNWKLASLMSATLADVRVLSTEEAEAIWRTGLGIFIDVLPRPPKQHLPAGTIWRDTPRLKCALD